MNTRKIVFLFTFLALLYLMRDKGLSASPTESSPDGVVRILLSDAKSPRKLWERMTVERLKKLSPYLSPSLQGALSKWIKASDLQASVGPCPEGVYDPLLHREFQPDKEKVGQPEYSGNTATVVVEDFISKESIRKISWPYRTRDRFILSNATGHWVLNEIEFWRKYGDGAHTVYNKTLSESLREQTISLLNTYHGQKAIKQPN